MRSKRKAFKALDTAVGFAALSSVLVLLNVTGVYAESSSVDNVTVTVPVSCSMTGTVGSEHTATVEIGTYTENIGETTFKVLCNDANGFAVYAIGYSDDTYGNTAMKPSTLPETNAIATGTATSGSTSNWAMKLTAVSGDYTPALATGFNDYHAVPAEYTKVASFASSTDATVGSSFKSTYAAFVAQTQPADTYTGKVKYTVVHPNDAATPLFSYVMQDVDSWGDSVVEGQEVIGIDARDGKSYTVARLADGNLWMTQNLDLDLDSTITYTPEDTDIPAAWTPSLSTYSTENTTWNNSATTPESYDPGDLYWNGTLAQGSTDNHANYISGNGDSHYHLGNYYNWTAAIAMNDSSSYTVYGTLINQSICPAGWTIPRAGYGEDSFYDLIVKHHYGDNLWSSPMHLSLSGGWDGSFEAMGFGGALYTPVAVSSSGVFVMMNTTAQYMEYGVGGSNNGRNRDYAVGVRCIARPVTNTVTFEAPPMTISDLQYMQDFNDLSADDKTSVLASMEDNTTYNLKDIRDNKTYAIAKMKDGKIWMAENLDLGRTELTADLTSTNTNLSTTITASTFNGWKKSSGTIAYDTGEFISLSGTDSISKTPYGTLYNYYAASAGTISGNTNSSDSLYDICPAGWRLPTGGSSGEFQTLYTQYNSKALMRATIINGGASFALSGYIDGSSALYVGTSGGYWTSTRSDQSKMHLLGFSMSSTVETAGTASRYRGQSIKCVAK